MHEKKYSAWTLIPLMNTGVRYVLRCNPERARQVRANRNDRINKIKVGVQLSAISFQQKQWVRETKRKTSDPPPWDNYLNLIH